jgi:hypothetical protein
VHQLNETVTKLNTGQGTAGKMITDPSVYESINDILIGINESKLLRWLIRNRQQSGIQQRYNQEQKTAPPVGGDGSSNTPPASSTAPPPATTTTTTTMTTTSAVPPPY